jgi:hypothetical protein
MAQVGVDLALSASEVHAALKRLAASRLISNDLNEGRPLLESVEEFHGGSDLPPVWPSPDGEHRGVSLEPLYKTVPIAARRDPILYEILALLDALRDGRAREKRFAEKQLISRLHRQAHARS